MPKNIIFDFDGTLVDTLDLAIDFGNANRERFGLREITKDGFRSRSMREALKHIGLRWYKLPKYVFELKQCMRSRIAEIELFPGVKEAIQSLYRQGHKLYILSSNSEENIRAVLSRYDIEHCFTAVASDSSIFGKHTVLKRLFKKERLNKIDSIYVGDEVRDIEACKRFGIDIIAVSWGWDDDARLRASGHQRIIASASALRSAADLTFS